MATNRYSEDCLRTTNFDRELKKTYLPAYSILRVTNLRGTILDKKNEEAQKLFSSLLANRISSISSTLPVTVKEQLDGIQEDSEAMIALENSINKKVIKKEKLSEVEAKFLEVYAGALQDFSKEQEGADIIKREMHKAGIQTAATATMYRTFTEKILPEHRNEVKTQLCAIVIGMLDKLEQHPNYKHFTRTEMIEHYKTKTSDKGMLTGFDALMYKARLIIQGRYNQMKQVSDNNKSVGEGFIMSDAQEELFHTLIEDDAAWAACVYMTKNILLEAEKVKIGTKVKYVSDMDEEDSDEANPDNEVQSAEEEGPEHFLLKVNTISSFNSMSREARSILYKLTTAEDGLLGFPRIVDTMLIHQQLLDIRHNNYCQDSDEFMEILKHTNTPWAQQLVEILQDPWKRTLMFNAHRKNHLDYVYHRKSSYFNRETNSRHPVAYRNTNGRSIRVLMGAYRAGLTTIDKNNQICIFSKEGKIVPSKKNQLLLTLEHRTQDIPSISLWDETAGTYDMRAWGVNTVTAALTEQQHKERMLDFINHINLALNLHLFESDINTIMSTQKNFDNFCSSVHAIVDVLGRNGSGADITGLLEDNRIRKSFHKLIKASKHTLTLQDQTSPAERAFRYNKSTFMVDTVPTSLGDNMERLAKAIESGVEDLHKYLEETYLNCPVFASKTPTGYHIYNAWLKALYEASEEDLSNPNSFARKFATSITRGLGTDTAEFSTFAEKDNYLFTLNEFFQSKQDSDGVLGATPLFVTGDSNSSRFLTTPIYTSEQCLEGMTENVIQEIQRMQMFHDLIDFLDENNLKVSDGHAGKTVKEWREGREEDMPPILRYCDKFTFFPFLNAYKDVILEAYRDSKSLQDAGNGIMIAKDPAQTELKKKIRKILEENLREKYVKFVEELSSKNIALQIGDSGVLRSDTFAVKNNSAKGLYDVYTKEDLWNFYLNNKFNLIQEEQFLTIDPGFYKNTEDFQKRFKETIAAGDLLDLAALDPSDQTGTAKIDDNTSNPGHQKVRYIDEIRVDLDTSDEEGGDPRDRAFMQVVRSVNNDEDIVGNPAKGKKGKYNKNTLTDGQGWRSLKSYRKLMIMRGEPHWTKAHEEVYQIIQENRAEGRTRLTEERLQRILDLGVVFQPLKPFYFGFEEILRSDGSKILVPVQHKYSEYPIIPELLPEGNRLGELGRAMEEDGTDLVCCTTCVKVGGFGSSDVRRCKTKEDFANSFKEGYPHQLPLRNWRQQSNIPEHVNTSRSLGTQFAKHGYGCLNNEETGNKEYSFLKRLFPSGKIRIAKNKVIDIKTGLNFNNLIQLYGALTSAHFMRASVKLNKQIQNPKEASDILSELRANDSRGAMDNISAYIVDEEGEMPISPSEGMMAVDNMASLQSKLRKEVIKRPVKGGSAVQVSPFGFEDILKVNCVEKGVNGKPNIIDADCAVPFALSYTYEDGTTVDLSTRYLEFVDYATGMPLDENGKGVEPARPTGNPGQEFYGWNTKLGQQFPGIFDLIAYRIPTEEDYSILNLKIRRFFPRTAGGTIIVPAQFTTIAGFDFDIDKLYFIRREFIYKKKANINNYDIWTDYYTESPIGQFIKPYLEQAKANAENRVEGTVWFGPGSNDYEYWGQALDLISAEQTARKEAGEEPKEGEIPLSEIPTNAKDAFEDWVDRNFNRYTKLISRYDENKTVLENHPAAVNNLLFNFIQARLEDPDTLKERVVPGGFQLLEDAKPVMMAIRYAPKSELAKLADSPSPLDALMTLSEKYKDFSPDYDPTELSTIAHYQTYNALYDNCISISAVQNINQRLTALLVEFNLKEAVKYGSLLESQDENAGKNIKARYVNGMDTELLTTNFLAASVDAVKKAVIEFFGIDDKTLNMTCLLTKTGSTPIDLGLLFNQPVCVRALEIMKEAGGYKKYVNCLHEALQELLGDEYRRYKDDFYNTLSEEGVRDSYVTSDKLVRYIALDATLDYGGNIQEFAKGQFAIAHLMSEIQANAQELAEEVAISQSTSIKSVKSDFGSIQAVLQKAIVFSERFGGKDSRFNVKYPSQIKKLIDPNLRFDETNMEEVLGNCVDSPFCPEQIAFSAIMGYAEALGDYFPYMDEGFTSLANLLGGLTDRGYLSADIFNAHNKAAMLFLLERMTALFNDSHSEVALAIDEEKTVNTGLSNRLFYTGVFPRYFQGIMNTNENAFRAGKTSIRYKNIPLLAAISDQIEQYDQGAGKNRLVLKMDGIGSLKGPQKDILLDSWAAMFYSDDPILRDMAKHLFMYSYYNRGFDFGSTTFMSLVPLVLKMELGDAEYREFFNRVFNVKVSSESNGILQELGGNVDNICIKEYLKAFILNTRNQFYQFTKKLYPSKESGSSAYSVAIDNMSLDTNKSQFTVSMSSEKDKPLLEQLWTPIFNEEKELVGGRFAPCVEIDGAVYICDSDFDSTTNVGFNVISVDKDTMTYYRMDTPVTMDYGAPRLYGSREEDLRIIRNTNLIDILKSIGEYYGLSQAETVRTDTEKGSNDDAGNTFGSVQGEKEKIIPENITTVGLAISTLNKIRFDLLVAIANGKQMEESAENTEHLQKLTTAVQNITGILSNLSGLAGQSISKYTYDIIKAISEELQSGSMHDIIFSTSTNYQDTVVSPFKLVLNRMEALLEGDLNKMADAAEKSEQAAEQNVCGL